MDSESMCINVCWREYRYVRTEGVAIGKNGMSGLCNDPGVETQTRESAETTKYVEKFIEGHI